MNKYTEMQARQYEEWANTWSVDNRDPVVGGFDLHNDWQDYNDYLFKDVNNTNKKICLDFGCGPGRNLVKFADTFKELHGVDISQKNLDNAVIWLQHNKKDISNHKLFLTNGTDLDRIESNSYDVVMSTICFQHICVHDIRYNFLKEFYRVLKPGGVLTMQMGFGPKVETKNSVGYYDNNIDAEGTNGQMDTRVENPTELQTDLEKIGFTKFNHYIRPVGPGDGHPNWIFFNATKK
jgi:ubiquinone/menaquinone biosynthesis C-methylase UbiE